MPCSPCPRGPYGGFTDGAANHVATLGLSEAERESIERFEAEVIQPSMSALVILDFWSDRSALSKQLSPVLEKLAAEHAGKGVKLAKVDVDKETLLASQFRVQSI